MSGLGFFQAHDSAIRAMTWSYNEQWLVSGDHDGYGNAVDLWIESLAMQIHQILAT